MTEHHGTENAIVRSIVLMSTLATAADVVHGISERRQGRDPSSQEEPHVAGSFVRQAVPELEEHLLSLRASRILSNNGGLSATVALSRRMNEVMILNYLARLLQGVHQRMLSLYPAVSPDIVEEARLLHTECAKLRDSGESSIADFVARMQAFCDAVRTEV